MVCTMTDLRFSCDEIPGMNNSLKTLSLLKERKKSIKTNVRDISFQKECSVNYL